MTKEELLQKLLDIAKEGRCDEENDHVDADKLLLQFINDESVTAAFDSIKKWYA